MSKISGIQTAVLPQIESTGSEDIIKLFNERITALNNSSPDDYKHLMEALQNGRNREAKAIIKQKIANDPQMLALADIIHLSEINHETNQQA